jgi:hypothetical protein
MPATRDSGVVFTAYSRRIIGPGRIDPCFIYKLRVGLRDALLPGVRTVVDVGNGVVWTLVNSNGITIYCECRQLFASSQETVGNFLTEIGAMTDQRNYTYLLKWQHKIHCFG